MARELEHAIVYSHPSGQVWVMYPDPSSHLEGESVQDWLDRVWAKGAPEWAISPKRIDPRKDLPKPRTTPILDEETGEVAGYERKFRAAWRRGPSGEVVEDLTLCRVRILDMIRKERNKRLVASDAEKNRLDDVGTNQQKQAIKLYRQTLRDLPAKTQVEVDAITTADGLDAYQTTWPS